MSRIPCKLAFLVGNLSVIIFVKKKEEEKRDFNSLNIFRTLTLSKTMYVIFKSKSFSISHSKYLLNLSLVNH